MDTRARRLVRLAAGLVVAGVVAVAGLVLTAGPATADPTPSPLPTLGPAGPTPPGDSNVLIPTPAPTAPVPTNLYTPGPTAPPPGSQPNTPAGEEDDPAWYDIPGQIRVAINEFIIWIATSSLDTVLGALTSTVMGSPDLINNAKVRAITDTTLVIANALLVLFVVLGGYLLTVRGTLQTHYGPQDILIRLALGGVGANLAIVVCGNILWIANAITAAIGGQGITGNDTAAALKATISNATGGNTWTVPDLEDSDHSGH